MDETREKGTPRRRRIIDRPRLTSALDASSANVRMLIASAGYGKTTLAEQWATGSGRRAAWYRIRESDADVAVLAVGVAETAARVVPGCDRRLRERLAATSRPSDEAGVLAAMLAEDLAEWPDDAWLVLDDHHVIEGSEEAEVFLETLIASAPLNVLIASRRRPSWVSTRRVLYGEVFELGQAALAMSREEAEEVLHGWRLEQTAGLIALAEGWPAVIGLAGVVPLPSAQGGEVPEELYSFFAEEVLLALDPGIRAGLGLLAVAPSLDRELAGALLGPGRADAVLDEGLATGIIDEHASGLELHPLARQFLDSRTAVELAGERMDAVARCRVVYERRRDWDALFVLVTRHGLEGELEPLLEEALEELMSAARLTTVETWVDRAERAGFAGPVFRLARAELNLRQGSHLAAQTLAEAVAEDLPDGHPLRFRALMTAAEAAHVAAKEEEALAIFGRALENSATPAEEREAAWGRLMCLTELESGDAQALLAELAAGVPSHDARELLRESGRRLGLELKLGQLESLDDARERAQLIAHVDDAMVRTSFRCVFSIALTMDADYEAAARVAEAMLEDAEAHRLDFTLPYAHTAAAAAYAGQRDFESAHAALASALGESKRINNFHAFDNARAQEIRVLCQQGLSEEACALEIRSSSNRLPSLSGELLTSRALALMSSGRVREAHECLRTTAGITTAIETRVLACAVPAIERIVTGKPDARVAVERLVEEVVSSGGFDLLITSYRACPELLTIMLGADSTRERSWQIVRRARDEPLAEASGFTSPERLDRRSRLSKREREIYQLLCQNLTNRQIASCLFISEATVKVHVQHIFDKLGVRSRTALALGAARERWSQATPAAIDTAEDTSSSNSASSLA